jgi:hypothetical protein
MPRRRMEEWIHVFLTLALAGGDRSPSRPVRFTSGETAPGVCQIVGWVGLRSGLYDVERSKILSLPRLELQSLGRPARSQSLYRLHCDCVQGKITKCIGNKVKCTVIMSKQYLLLEFENFLSAFVLHMRVCSAADSCVWSSCEWKTYTSRL